MDIDWAAFWTAVAAVATSIAVIVFWWQSRKQLRQDKTHFDTDRSDREEATTRADVSEFAGATSEVCERVIDGSAVISMCWLAAEQMVDVADRGSKGAGAKLRDRLHSLIEDEDGPFLSLWTRGMELSPSMSTLTERAATLPGLARRMRGDLTITWLLADIVVDMVYDIRRVFLIALQDEEDGPKLRQLLVAHYLQGDDEADLVSGFANSLHGNLAGYIAARKYPEAAATISEIVSRVDQLPAAQLLAATKAGVPSEPTTTRTEEMSVIASRLFERANDDARAEVLSLIDELGRQVAKPAVA